MTTHLLYIYRNDPLGGEELRYSLRSVEQHLHLDDIEVTIVGDKPGWMHGVNHVAAENPHSNKPANMAYKTALGCRELMGEKQVVYMEDDSVLLDHQTSIVPVYRGDLMTHIQRIERAHGKGFWMSEALRGSLRVLADHPAPQSWEVHRPTPIDPESALPIIEPLARSGFLVLCRSVWGTLTLEGWPADDARYVGTTPAPSRGIPWVSLDECVPTPIAKMFRTPSRWEEA